MMNRELTRGGAPPRVLFPLTPFDDESAVGFIRRTAAWNRIPMKDLLTAAGAEGDYGPAGLARRSEQIAAVLGIPLREFERRMLAAPGSHNRVGRSGAFQHFGMPVRAHHLNARTFRYAPAALEKASYHRAIWHIAPLTFCAETWQLLLERCPNCEARLALYAGKDLHTCYRCRFDLRQATSELVPTEIREELHLLARVLSHEAGTSRAATSAFPEPFRALPLATLLDVVLLLARCANEADRQRYSAARNLTPEMLARGCRIALEYPHSFAGLAAAHAGNDTMAPFFSRLSSSVLQADPLVRQMVTSLVAEHEPVRHGPTRLKQLREHAGRISLGEAARVLRVENAAVRKLIAAGALQTSRGRGERRCHDWLEPQSVEALQIRLSARLSAAEFRSQFGLPHEGIEQLVSAGLISALDDSAIQRVYPGLQLQRDCAFSFVGTVERSLKPHSDVRTITLREAFHGIGGKQKPWASVLKAAVDQTLPQPLSINAGSSLKLEELLIADGLAWDLVSGRHPRLLDTPIRSQALGSAPDLSRTDVERYLNCYPRDVSWLIRHGHLGPGREAHSFCRATVEALGVALISSREISWRWRVSPPTREALHSKHGIHRAVGPFWPRDQVEQHFGRLFPGGRPT